MSETSAPRAECLCTNRFIHTHCLRDVIEKTGQLHCSVCLAPYDVVIKKSKKIVLTGDGHVCILMIVANLFVLVVGVFVLYFSYSFPKLPFVILISIMGTTFLAVILMTVWWVYVVRSYNIRFIKIKKIIKVMSLPQRIAV